LNPKLDKYQKSYQEFDKQNAIYKKAINWDKATTGSTIWKNDESFLAGMMDKLIVGDQLRNKESLKVLIYATNWKTGITRAITLSQWVGEGWKITNKNEANNVTV
jgi:hypothetical protein